MTGADFHRRVVDLVEPDAPEPRSYWTEAIVALEILQTFAFSATAMLLAWAVGPTLVPGWTSAAIVSGSMAPTVEVGDVVVFRPASLDDLAPDAVIRFGADAGTITHRIVDIDAEGRITTRGDANGSVDRATVTIEGVEGLGVLVVPLVGYPIVWADQGRTMPLLALATALIVMSLPAVVRSRREPARPVVAAAPLGPLVAGRLQALASDRLLATRR